VNPVMPACRFGEQPFGRTLLTVAMNGQSPSLRVRIGRPCTPVQGPELGM
jgi:hypothetical protein